MTINHAKRFLACDRAINECVGGDGGWINRTQKRRYGATIFP